MIYILEDDDSIRKLVTYALERQGFSAAGFAAPAEFRAAMEVRLPSLLLLDIMLPEEDGISILKKLRADPRTARIPVIVLTAKGEEYDRVEGLDAGADDYVTKPFGMMELLARVRALLRRAKMSETTAAAGESETNGALASETAAGDLPAGSPPGDDLRGESAQMDPAGTAGVRRDEDKVAENGLAELHFGDLRIFPERYEVFVGGEPAALTKKEYHLLLLLARNEGIVLTREVLMDRIWDLGTEPENRTLDVHIRKVRTKLGEEGRRIETVRGVGYRFRGKETTV